MPPKRGRGRGRGGRGRGKASSSSLQKREKRGREKEEKEEKEEPEVEEKEEPEASGGEEQEEAAGETEERSAKRRRVEEQEEEGGDDGEEGEETQVETQQQEKAGGDLDVSMEPAAASDVEPIPSEFGPSEQVEKTGTAEGEDAQMADSGPSVSPASLAPGGASSGSAAPSPNLGVDLGDGMPKRAAAPASPRSAGAGGYAERERKEFDDQAETDSAASARVRELYAKVYPNSVPGGGAADSATHHHAFVQPRTKTAQQLHSSGLATGVASVPGEPESIADSWNNPQLRDARYQFYSQSKLERCVSFIFSPLLVCLSLFPTVGCFADLV
jgi:hypothetical protein